METATPLSTPMWCFATDLKRHDSGRRFVDLNHAGGRLRNLL
jgi:hypothetical protein